MSEAERISYYKDGNGYLSCLHPDNFRGWFFVTDDKGRKLKFQGTDLCPEEETDAIEVLESVLWHNEVRRIAEELDRKLLSELKEALCPDKVEPKYTKVYDDGVIQFYEHTKPASDEITKPRGL